MTQNGLSYSQVGAFAEAHVTAELLAYGYDVLKPTIGSARYDLAIILADRLLRLQVKLATIKEGSIRFSCTTANGAKKTKTSYVGDCELIVGYCPENGSAYAIRPEDAPTNLVSLRITPSRNDQKRSIRWAEDHRLKSMLAQLESEAGGIAVLSARDMDSDSKRPGKRSAKKPKLVATA